MAVCPRCNVALTEKTATPPGRSVAVTLDSCGTCRGMWLDGAELPYVSAVLGELVVRHRELIGDARTGIDCPRCGGALRILDVGNVAIDWCRQCFGVWLDGGEYQALEHHRPQPQPDRGSASVRCGRCQKTVPLGQTFYSASGLLCSPCHDKDEADTRWASQFRRPIANQLIAASESMLQPTTQDEIRSLRREVSFLRSELNRF